VKCHCHYVFLLRFVVHNCYLIFASCYAAASGEKNEYIRFSEKVGFKLRVKQ